MSEANSAGFADSDTLARISQFLAFEAKLLDERRFKDWLQLLDSEVTYEVPLRQAQQKYEDEFHATGFRISDDRKLLENRVARHDTGHDWAERPPSRTLRLIGSVMVKNSQQPGVFEVESAVIIYRQRGSDMPGDIIPVRRTDLIKETENGLRILRRRALLTETVLHTPNLGIFL